MSLSFEVFEIFFELNILFGDTFLMKQENFTSFKSPKKLFIKNKILPLNNKLIFIFKLNWDILLIKILYKFGKNPSKNELCGEYNYKPSFHQDINKVQLSSLQLGLKKIACLSSKHKESARKSASNFIATRLLYPPTTKL